MAVLISTKTGRAFSRRIRALHARVIAIALLMAGVLHGRAAEALSKEYQLKAVFLFNFVQFVEWPQDAFADPKAPLIIGVLGEDPFGGFLEETIRGEKVGGHALEIQRRDRLEDFAACHVLFVSSSEDKRIQSLLAQLKMRAVLTVGESDDFARSGGMIRFFTDKNKIRFRINPKSVKEGRLIISSKLLRLAELAPRDKE